MRQKLEGMDKEFAEKKRLFDAARESVRRAKEEYNDALKTYHIAAQTTISLKILVYDEYEVEVCKKIKPIEEIHNLLIYPFS